MVPTLTTTYFSRTLMVTTLYFDQISPAHTIPVVVCYRYNSLVSPLIVIVGDSCGFENPQYLRIGGVCQQTDIYHITY